jgi:hypothetical protein
MPVYGGRGDVMGVRLKTNIQKRSEADVKMMMRRGVNGRRSKTMMESIAKKMYE